MKRTLARKILERHMPAGSWETGAEAPVKIDQTLTQDATGTLVYLEFAALGLNGVRTRLSASYVDHNLLETDPRPSDDHRFLMTSAQRYGVYFSAPGNGVSHPVHLERFGVPGATLLGSDSHTCTAGALGMVAMGAGGVDVALAMAGEPFPLRVPAVTGVRLTGRLSPWVSAKDVILEMLRRHTVKGGLGRIIEYYGPGVKTLSVTERATIANMGAELGATTSVFPSDERTRDYLKRQSRARAWRELKADKGAEYDEHDEMDLSRLVPLVALPGSPDAVVEVGEVEGTPVDQVIVGSSVNFSFRDMMVVARVLKGRGVAPGVDMHINPGSRRVLASVELAGGTAELTRSGVRIQQAGCLGCIGMGQVPATGAVSLRTFPRNFPGRSGANPDRVYLVSPEVAAASALRGRITDPRTLGPAPRITEPGRYAGKDAGVVAPLPAAERRRVKVLRGPSIPPLPELTPIEEGYEGVVLIKTGDDVTTDHILPAGNEVLPLRSNIPAISRHVFKHLDAGFVARAEEAHGGVVAGGENYGQGSSREHAALAPRFLGVRVKVALGFARIHRANLINFGIVPLLFRSREDYAAVEEGDTLKFPEIRKAVMGGAAETFAIIEGRNEMLSLRLDLSTRERSVIVAGGVLNLIRDRLVGRPEGPG